MQKSRAGITRAAAAETIDVYMETSESLDDYMRALSGNTALVRWLVNGVNAIRTKAGAPELSETEILENIENSISSLRFLPAGVNEVRADAGLKALSSTEIVEIIASVDSGLGKLSRLALAR